MNFEYVIRQRGRWIRAADPAHEVVMFARRRSEAMSFASAEQASQFIREHGRWLDVEACRIERSGHVQPARNLETA